jgi:hypothetical protein
VPNCKTHTLIPLLTPTHFLPANTHLLRLLSTMPSSPSYKGPNYYITITLLPLLTLTHLSHSCPHCLRHGGTIGLTTQHSHALRPLLHPHTLNTLLARRGYNCSLDSFPRCLLHGGTKGLTAKTSMSPLRVRDMPATLPQLCARHCDFHTRLFSRWLTETPPLSIRPQPVAGCRRQRR